MNPPDNNLLQTAEELKKGGWIVAMLGAAGALCRLLLAREDVPWWLWVRRIIAGGIVGVLCYFAVHGHVEPLYEAIIYSCCGSATPEIIALVQSIITRSNRTNGKNQRSR
jgi:hypothetical protein